MSSSIYFRKEKIDTWVHYRSLTGSQEEQQQQRQQKPPHMSVSSLLTFSDLHFC